MSKVDTLLRQAVAFELLSLYGERRDYFRALSQEMEYVTGPGQKITLDPSKIPAPGQAAPDTHEIPSPPVDTTVSVPEQTIAVTPPSKKPQMDPETVRTLQIFLNKAFRDDIIAGRMGPIREDYAWGPETEGRLKQWGRKYNIPADNVHAIAYTALKQSRMA